MKPNGEKRSVEQRLQQLIEFASDGERDSLTGVLAPARFLEIVASELQISRRESRKITLISIKCICKVERGGATLIEGLLLNFAQVATALMRRGDRCGRVAEDGFWILIRGDRSSADRFIARLFTELDETDWSTESIEIDEADDMKNLLRKMDLIHFTKEAN